MDKDRDTPLPLAPSALGLVAGPREAGEEPEEGTEFRAARSLKERLENWGSD